MCRFKRISVDDYKKASEFQYILCVGSSAPTLYPIVSIVWFQYILCVGSSLLVLYFLNYSTSFNTSYVSVQAAVFGLFSSSKEVSIHPMCRFKYLPTNKHTFDYCFNTSYVSVQGTTRAVANHPARFQYILCVGSRISC